MNLTTASALFLSHRARIVATMKPITHIRPTPSISGQSAEKQGFDPEIAFADPVRYLAGLGIDSQLVSLSGPAAVQEAA